MSRSPDLAILGGGIAGLTVALAVAARGGRVVVVDQPRHGAASRTSAGLLAATIDGATAEALEAAVAARDAYPAFLDRLQERAGVEVALDRGGILEIIDRAPTEAGRLADSAPDLDAETLRRVEPSIAAARAIFHPLDGAVDNRRLMDALDRAVAREPQIERRQADVVAVEIAAAASALVTLEGRVLAGRVLVAGGAWAAMLPGLPRAIPVRPVQGQMLRLDRAPVHHVIVGAGGYLVPRGDTLLVGATSEESGFDCATSDEGLATLRALASRLVPSLSEATVLEHWAGLRPMSADGLPILGLDPDHPSLAYACGYSRNGILFAPWAAELLAGVLLGGERPAGLDAFRIGRFDRG